MEHSVTLLIQHQVRAEATPAYEGWLKAIAQAGRQFPGHMGVSIIRPHGTGAPYTMLLRFDRHSRLADWIDSATRLGFMERAQPWLESVQESELETGLEYWFTPSSLSPLRARPFKQFLITVSAIYPLTLVLPWLMSPLLKLEPLARWPSVQNLLVVLVVVYLMVYAIMPRYTRLVARWLFR